MSEFKTVDQEPDVILVHDWCPFCHTKEILTEKDNSRICSGCNQTFIHLTEEQALFEAARKLNPKHIRSSGRPADYRKDDRNKCATIDCYFHVATDSIFCYSCDNERQRPIKDQAYASMASGSVTEEISRRRKAIQDNERGISKAIL